MFHYFICSDNGTNITLPENPDSCSCPLDGIRVVSPISVLAIHLVRSGDNKPSPVTAGRIAIGAGLVAKNSLDDRFQRL